MYNLLENNPLPAGTVDNSKGEYISRSQANISTLLFSEPDIIVKTARNGYLGLSLLALGYHLEVAQLFGAFAD
jgi:hypothetical protein